METQKAVVGSIIKIGKHKYQVTDAPISDGCRIWNEPTKELDYCVAVFGDGTMCVQFGEQAGSSRGMRAVLRQAHYSKVIQLKNTHKI